MWHNKPRIGYILRVKERLSSGNKLINLDEAKPMMEFRDYCFASSPEK
jgi:hypothetical protein